MRNPETGNIAGLIADSDEEEEGDDDEEGTKRKKKKRKRRRYSDEQLDSDDLDLIEDNTG